MKNYVYRGVRYTFDEQNVQVAQATNKDKATQRRFEIDKVYRGFHYLRAPRWHHLIVDHVYRGAHYMA